MCASSGVVAAFPRYKSTASATYPCPASFCACSFTQSFSPHHSWITTIAGCLPPPSGSARYPLTVSLPLVGHRLCLRWPGTQRYPESKYAHRENHHKLFFVHRTFLPEKEL